MRCSHTEDPRLFRTCMFSTYMTDYMPAIMREINSLYDVDGLFTNAWPPLGSLPVCHCDECRKLPRAGDDRLLGQVQRAHDLSVEALRFHRQGEAAVEFLFRQSRRRHPFPADLVQLGELCEWFQADNQGRGGDDTPIWGCALQGRVCSAVQKGKMATNVTGGMVHRHAPLAQRLQVAAGRAHVDRTRRWPRGMVPYHHIIGGENGMGEDRRWLEPGAPVLQLDGEARRHFVNKRSIANLGVVMGQRTQLFYKPPRGSLMPQYMDGMYYALLEGRFLFDFVHEDKLAPEISRNIPPCCCPTPPCSATSSAANCAPTWMPAVRCWPPLRPACTTERNERRAGFRPGGRLRHPQGGRVSLARTGNAYLCAHREAARDSRRLYRHELDPRRGDTACPSRRSRHPILTVVPGFVAYPPELSYPAPAADERTGGGRAGKGQEPAGLLPGRYRAHHVASGHTDLARLLQNSIRWVAGANPPVTIEGEGVIETIRVGDRGWLRRPRPELHESRHAPRLDPGVLSHRCTESTNDTARRETRHPRGTAAGRNGHPVSHRAGATIEFTIPGVLDYEVAAMYSI